jgi:hypothetical protein
MSAPDSQWWQRYGNVAQIAAAVVSLIGFGALVMQFQEVRHNNRATGARQVYLAYTDLNFRYPHFGAPDYDKLKTGDPLIFEQYKSFVSYLLYACSEVLHAFPRDSDWRRSCEYEVRPQLPYLCESQLSDPEFLPLFGRRIVRLVTEEMKRNGVSAPECQLKKT